MNTSSHKNKTIEQIMARQFAASRVNFDNPIFGLCPTRLALGSSLASATSQTSGKSTDERVLESANAINVFGAKSVNRSKKGL